MKYFFLNFLQVVKLFFQKKILPNVKYSTAEVELNLSGLSLILTTTSIQFPKLGYGCIVYDCIMLLRAFLQGQLYSWQSAISMLSIGLTVASLFATGNLGLLLGIASVSLDIFMQIYALSNYVNSGSWINIE